MSGMDDRSTTRRFAFNKKGCVWDCVRVRTHGECRRASVCSGLPCLGMVVVTGNLIGKLSLQRQMQNIFKMFKWMILHCTQKDRSRLDEQEKIIEVLFESL